MATSRQAATLPQIPAIATPAALELRQVQAAIDNIREGLQRLQRRLDGVTLESGNTTRTVQRGTATTAALASQVQDLQRQLAELIEAAGETPPAAAPALRLLLGDDGADGEDGQAIPGPRGELPIYIEFPAAAGGLGGHRAVRLVAGEASYADNTNVPDANLVLGVTRGAVVAGDLAQIQVTGLMTESSWAWTPDAPVFVGAAGVLTQPAPASGFALMVGIATAADQILIGARMPIVLV